MHILPVVSASIAIFLVAVSVRSANQHIIRACFLSFEVWDDFETDDFVSAGRLVVQCIVTWTRGRICRYSPQSPPSLSGPPLLSSPFLSSLGTALCPRSSRTQGSRGWTSPGWRCTSHYRWSRAPCSPQCRPDPAQPRPQGSPQPGPGQRF